MYMGVSGGTEPFLPVGDVGAIADRIRSPAVVRVADEVVVFTQFQAEVAIAVGQPVLAGRVVDEDQLHRLIGWVGVIGLGDGRRGLTAVPGSPER